MSPGVAEIVLGGVILAVIVYLVRQGFSIPELKRRVAMLETDMTGKGELIGNMNALLIRVDERLSSMQTQQNKLQEQVATIQSQMNDLREDIVYLKSESCLRGKEKANA